MKKEKGYTISKSGGLLFFLILFSHWGWGQIKPLYTYYDLFYGARSIGMANAFTAMADDLTAVFRNPAGVAELNVPQIFVDYRSDKMNYTYAPQLKDYTTYQEQFDYTFHSTLKNMDFVAISAPVNFWDIKWSFALSYYRAFPFGIKGTAESRFNTTNTTGTNQLSTLQITGSSGIDVLAFTGAFYLNDYFSFGITMQRYFNSGTTALDFTATPAPPVSYTREYTDKFKDTSLILGLRFKMAEEIILGVSYQFGCSGPLTSQNTYQEKTSTTAVTTTSAATLVIPTQYAVGLLMKPFKFMDLAVDYSRQYWGIAATLTNYYGSSTALQFPVRNDFSFPQKDTIHLRMGTQLNIPLKKATVFIRGGLFSDKQLFTDSLQGSVRFKGHSLGLGLEIKPWLQVDAAYMRQKGRWQETAYFDTTTTVNTTAINKIFCVSLTFKFGTPPVEKVRQND